MSYGLPSTDEQIAAIRDEAELSISHIDTCLSSYLQDHHNRPGECLLGVYVDGSTTRGELLQGLLDEIVQSTDYRVPDRITWDDMKACAKSLFAEAFGTSAEAMALPFNDTLDKPDPDEDDMIGGDEMCQAWFLLVWTPTDEEIAS